MYRLDAPLNERKVRDVAIELWRCFDQQRFRDALPSLSEDFEAHWPNIRERICGPENLIVLNENYPGAWCCAVRRIDECTDAVVTVTEISDGDTSLFTVSYFEVRYGRIVRAEEYFADNGPPPHDRPAFRLYFPWDRLCTNGRRRVEGLTRERPPSPHPNAPHSWP